ncbi:MAG TPA: hypothetical protein VFC47_05190 [Caulobacteraceae bacterium]|nr:hypothetical protein [Caulobacteraceae bacterium]
MYLTILAILLAIWPWRQRWHAVGAVGTVVILLVVHMYPEPDDEAFVRIVGARKATPRERRRYEHDIS